jgi:hypothetical protein
MGQAHRNRARDIGSHDSCPCGSGWHGRHALIAIRLRLNVVGSRVVTFDDLLVPPENFQATEGNPESPVAHRKLVPRNLQVAVRLVVRPAV